jgi:hypothetical protein
VGTLSLELKQMIISIFVGLSKVNERRPNVLMRASKFHKKPKLKQNEHNLKKNAFVPTNACR